MGFIEEPHIKKELENYPIFGSFTIGEQVIESLDKVTCG